MKQPWIKWYPADWRSDPRLRMCSLAARGLWADLLSYMHEGDQYGHLMIHGTKPSEQQIAALVGRPLAETRKALAELEATQVFSRTDDGTIYSRRMVRDHEKAATDRDNGKRGGNPKLDGDVKAGVNPPVKGEDKAQMLDARSQIPEKESTSLRSVVRASDWPDGAFESFWDAYPNKVGKKAALRAFAVAKRSGVAWHTITVALDKYIYEKPHDRAWCNPATWLNQGRWDDQPANVSANGQNSFIGLELQRSQNEHEFADGGEPEFAGIAPATPR